jgi:hypothetical protein
MLDIAAFLTAAVIAVLLLWQVTVVPLRRRRRKAKRPGYIDLRPRY